jgi:hypothetical protein
VAAQPIGTVNLYGRSAFAPTAEATAVAIAAQAAAVANQLAGHTPAA